MPVGSDGPALLRGLAACGRSVAHFPARAFVETTRGTIAATTAASPNSEAAAPRPQHRPPEVVERPRRDGALPAERLPVILEVLPNADYALIDSGERREARTIRPLSDRAAGGAGDLAARRCRESEWHKRRCDLHRRYRRGRHGPLALSKSAARRDLADAP